MWFNKELKEECLLKDYIELSLSESMSLDEPISLQNVDPIEEEKEED